MPELPEIISRATEMKQALTGRTITGIDVLQPKCLNVSEEEFTAALTGAEIVDVTHRGKWLFVETSRGWLLLNLGMGGEILLAQPDALPEKRRLVFHFAGSESLSINFWWFGYAHFAHKDGLAAHAMSAKLGPNATDVSLPALKDMLAGQRGQIKAFLLDQTHLAGIGNAYIHDILFLARLHPQRRINTLSEAEIEALHRAIHAGLQPSIDKGGAFYEVSLRGEKGGFTFDDVIIGYREGQPCPECGSPVEKIKTGSTSSFICPQCQK